MKDVWSREMTPVPSFFMCLLSVRRGASQVYFCFSFFPCLSFIRKNVTSVGIGDNTKRIDIRFPVLRVFHHIAL